MAQPEIAAQQDQAERADAVPDANDAPVAGGDRRPIEAAAAEPPRKLSTGEFIVVFVSFLVQVVILCLKLPFLGGAQNLIGLLIIGFALWGRPGNSTPSAKFPSAVLINSVRQTPLDA